MRQPNATTIVNPSHFSGTSNSECKGKQLDLFWKFLLSTEKQVSAAQDSADFEQVQSKIALMFVGALRDV